MDVRKWIFVNFSAIDIFDTVIDIYYTAVCKIDTELAEFSTP